MCFFGNLLVGNFWISLKPSGKSEGLGIGIPAAPAVPGVDRALARVVISPGAWLCCWRVFSVDEFHRSLLGPGGRREVRV